MAKCNQLTSLAFKGLRYVTVSRYLYLVNGVNVVDVRCLCFADTAWLSLYVSL